MEEAFASWLWRTATVLSGEEIALRNALARLQSRSDAGEPCWFGEHGFMLSLGEPLASYALRLELDGPAGRLTACVECASLHPEYSVDTLEALRETGADLRELVDWSASTWIEALEQLTGCTFRLADVAVGVPPLAAGVAFSARSHDRRMAHLMLAGPAVRMLGALGTAGRVRRTQPWMRIPLARVQRLKALSQAELRLLAPGAAVDLLDSEPMCVIGHGDQRKELTVRELNEEEVEIFGEIHAQGVRDAGHPLWSMDDITLDLDVVLARESLAVDEAAALCVGSVLPLKAACRGEQVSLYCQGLLIARGRLVRTDDRLAVLITHCRGNGA